MVDPEAYVAQRIVQRYGHPGRTAYVYLFRVKPDSDLGLLIPTAESVHTVWIDEGSGLIQSTPAIAIANGNAIRALQITTSGPQKLTSHQRRQMMARSIVFIAIQSAENEVSVTLVSRSLTFSPKGDRTAHEKWLRMGEDWFSAYQPDY